MTDDISNQQNPERDLTPDKDKKRQTSRISLDNARPVKPAMEQKKATSSLPGAIPHGVPIPQTVHLKRPPTSLITPRTPGLPPDSKISGDTALIQAGAETVKRHTAPIVPADSQTDIKRGTGPIPGIPSHAGPIPQTIRLKRPVAAPVIRPPTSQVHTEAPAAAPIETQEQKYSAQPVAEAPTIVRRVSSAKAQTSRIVLEAPTIRARDISAKKTASQISPIPIEEPSQPKTIRLKRPSRLDSEEEAGLDAESAKKGETAKIELPSDSAALTPIAQRKTIKIKRVDSVIAPGMAKTDSVAAPQSRAVIETPASAEGLELVFSIVSALAVLCVGALVYIMAAQKFGVHLPLPSSMMLH